MIQKTFFVKFRYLDEDRERTIYIPADNEEQAITKVKIVNGYQIEILECYEYH